MNIIGISGLSNSVAFKRRQFPGLSEREYRIAQGFDGAAALVRNGEVLAAAAEERFTGEKATGAFPVNAIRYCLEASKLNFRDIEFVAHGFSYEPFKSQFDADEDSSELFREVLRPKVHEELLRKNFPATDWPERLVPVQHHLAHAASAFYPSGYERALIVVSDGMGEVHSATIAVGEGKDISIIAQVPAFHSLGTLYGVVTMYLGFWMNSDEYKVMGLAPYGNPDRFYRRMMEFVSLRNDGTYTVPFFTHNVTPRERETHAGVLRFLADQFGPARPPEGEITQFHRDIAAALQKVLETCQFHVLTHFQQKTGQKQLCMSGGVALNCSLNGAVRRSGMFGQVFVQPAAGDDGTALGAALYAARSYDPQFRPLKMSVPLWGPEFSGDALQQALSGRQDLRAAQFDNFDALCEEVAARIDQGQIVAWFQGKMEFGPRALGNRSILADPRRPDMRERLNSLVKKREGFRPFAPAVIEEAAARFFEITPGDEDTFAQMLFVAPVRSEFREKLPAVTHVDGSARVQTVSFGDNPRLWKLLKAFETRSGMPVLLNTSFNVRGQPIVCYPQQALDTFLAANLDAVVLGDILVTAVRKDASTTQPTRAATAMEMKGFAENLVPHEEFWVDRLRSLESVALPYPRKKSQPHAAERSEHIRQKVPASVPADFVIAGLSGFLARIAGLEEFDVAFKDTWLSDKAERFNAVFADRVPLRLRVALEKPFAETLRETRAEIENVRSHQTYALGIFNRHPGLCGNDTDSNRFCAPIGVWLRQHGARRDCEGISQQLGPGRELTLVIPEEPGESFWEYDPAIFEPVTIIEMAEDFANFLKNLVAAPEVPLSHVAMLDERDRRKVLLEWNDTRVPFPEDARVHELIGAQVQRTPGAVAVVFEEQELSYSELNSRADRLAELLRMRGVGPDVLVGVCVEVCLEMLVGLLGVLKAGGAYVPLDPSYPKDRLAFMLQDARASLLLTQKHILPALPATETPVLCLDDAALNLNGESPERLGVQPGSTRNSELNGGTGGTQRDPGSSPLAYVIYTSGSTGNPKGVMVTHRNVANFFTGMDERLGSTPPGVWQAVTSISFDISVLELFWTLARGFKVVLNGERPNGRRRSPQRSSTSKRNLDFSLFYFASHEAASKTDKYRLLLEGARFADEHGFAAVWTPERHFHAFGGLYPNPSVTSAALAVITKRIQLRAGSVVLPLHNPVRVAEEWSVVDNLSNGRVALSIASGWQINDFALAPENYSRRKEVMIEQLEILRRLWRGDHVSLRGAGGQSETVKIMPRPIQPELPLWLTASGHPGTFELAGHLGLNLLTHLLGQSAEQLAHNIELYRSARRKAGHSGDGRVTVMLHTFVGGNREEVREKVRAPFTAYLRSSFDLIKNDPLAFSAFKRPKGTLAQNGDSGPSEFTPEEIDAICRQGFERYFETSGLFGTPHICLGMAERLRASGVDEIACLIDFGVETESVLASLEQLDRVRQMANQDSEEFAQKHSPARELARHKATHLQCTPSLAAIIAEEPEGLAALRSLKTLMLGGESLPADLLQRIDTSGQVMNMYGPTETTIWSTTHEVTKQDKRILIGRPIANTETYIVDKNLQPVPVGIPGELLIGGAGVVRGYLNRPDLTAQKFIPNPFAKEQGGSLSPRLYRTGDLARYWPDGRIEHLGRLDHQVKLRGFRIELSEIEAVLRSHQSVNDCAVEIRNGPSGDKRLVGYIVSRFTEPPADKGLRDFLRQKLPEQMVPATFIQLDRLPMTPNGKLDRKALPNPENWMKPAKLLSPPQSEVEQQVAAVWVELLGTADISLGDNFFELGGNSVLATQLMSRLRAIMLSELPLELVFEHPELGSLAREISNRISVKRRSAGSVPLSQRQGAPKPGPTRRLSSGSEAPLSFAQQRLWFVNQLEPGPHYNEHFELRISGTLRPELLREALNEIVRRHEVLRTKFVERDGTPVQVVSPPVSVDLPVFGAGNHVAAERETEAERVIASQNRQPFALEKGMLFRACLIRVGEEDHILALTLHHIIVDGWSFNVLFKEISTLYQAFCEQRPSPLPDLQLQYGDFAEWQQLNFQDGAAMRRGLEYWKQQLKGAPGLLELPTDRPRAAMQSYQGARFRFDLGKDLVQRLSDLGRQEGCTLFMVLLAGFQTLLSRYAETDVVLVGSPIANRIHPEAESLVGLFLNSLVLRGDLSGAPTFEEVLRRVRKTALEAYAHRDVPFEHLVTELKPERDLRYNPLFQVMLVLQNGVNVPVTAGEATFRSVSVDTGISKYDLTLNLEEGRDGLQGWFEYATALFDASTVEGMADSFRMLLKACVEQPEKSIAELAPRPAASVRGSSAAPEAAILPGAELGAARFASSARVIQSQRTATEAKLAEIWSEVIGIQQVGPEEDLFELGGHSLLITRIISRIRKIFGVEVPIYAFFETPTVRGIAATIEELMDETRVEASETWTA